MYEDLVKRLDAYSAEHEYHGGITAEAADAIEELSREYESIAASLNESVELVRKLQQPRWIPVTERLPEDGQAILAVQSWDGKARIVPANYDRGLWYDCIFDCPAEHITHWMPVPEPPED